MPSHNRSNGFISGHQLGLTGKSYGRLESQIWRNIWVVEEGKQTACMGKGVPTLQPALKKAIGTSVRNFGRSFVSSFGALFEVL